MKLSKLLDLDYVKKIDDNSYLCHRCNQLFSKLGVINHHFYCHEEKGIKKREELKEKVKKNNNTPEMKEKISEKTKQAFQRSEVKENIQNYARRMSFERTGEGNPMYGKNHSEEWKENHSKIMTGLKHTRESKEKIRQAATGRKHKIESIQKMRNKKIDKTHSEETRLKMSKSAKRHTHSKPTIEKLKEKYPFFSKIEEMRYNPDKPGEIQVHCKNHNCPNSKEHGGWFTSSRDKFYSRIYALERPDGNDGNYFYCSEKCKNTCPLFGLNPICHINKNDEITTPYTQEEYQTFRQHVLERDNYKCQYCGKQAKHVHHERPQKLEPFFSLDPDLAWSVCVKCHYKHGHKNECSTNNIATIECKG